MRWSGRAVVHDLRGGTPGVRLDRRKREGIDGGVGVADLAQSVLEPRPAAVVQRLRDQQNRTPVSRGRGAELVYGEGQRVKDGCALVSRLEIVERRGGGIDAAGEWHEDRGRRA